MKARVCTSLKRPNTFCLGKRKQTKMYCLRHCARIHPPCQDVLCSTLNCVPGMDCLTSHCMRLMRFGADSDSLSSVWVAASYKRPDPEDLPRDPGFCEDRHEKCKQWASDGECEKNPNYMVCDHSTDAGEYAIGTTV